MRRRTSCQYLDLAGSSRSIESLTLQSRRAASRPGTPNDEILQGTNQDDTISARGGDDVVLGREGEDRLRGGTGEDSLYGGRGEDFLHSEDIFSQSGAFRDLVDCGPGRDRASVDFRDRVVDCERVVTAIP